VIAAVVEQRGEENGLVWPASISPYDAHVIALAGAEEIAGRAAERLSAAGREVLLDDRDARAGEKFADADLIGIPLRVTAGKKSLEDGMVDVKDRETGEERRVSIEELA
jgi:prolyl-tRNA synthetase